MAEPTDDSRSKARSVTGRKPRARGVGARSARTVGSARSEAGHEPGPTDSELRDAVIVGGNRIPFGKVGGAYQAVGNKDMLTAALEGLIARFGLQGEQIGEVGAGAVLKHARDFNLSREAVLGSSLHPATPAYDLQQACATGLEATIQLANKIRLGQLDSAIAGGTDSTSDAPIEVSNRLRLALLRASHAHTLPARLKALATIRPGDLAPSAPSADEPRTGLSMGEHQAITTAAWAIPRTEQDELALASHQHLATAYDDGFFDDLLTPYQGLTRDETLRPDTSLDKLAALKPVFGCGLAIEPTMTAGNSTPLSDGAATVLLASPQWAAEHRLPQLARIVDAQVAAVDYVNGAEGLLMAPVYATPILLARNGLSLQDFDFYEIHEAFAATVLCTLAAWADETYCRDRLGLDKPLGEIDRNRLNVHGSSLAAGHPFAATGARIVASTAAMLARAKAAGTSHTGRALISICAAGGQGVVAILEAL